MLIVLHLHLNRKCTSKIALQKIFISSTPLKNSLPFSIYSIHSLKNNCLKCYMISTQTVASVFFDLCVLLLASKRSCFTLLSILPPFSPALQATQVRAVQQKSKHTCGFCSNQTLQLTIILGRHSSDQLLHILHHSILRLTKKFL